ncbi:OsmC family protein [Umezawaea tangerina]|uniref:Putative OsmC-like protein n=1 Tax=Umezawaea tangerina TaxID=84725 RepID=A0A2T0SPB1_9PSEU|nr:OsmC family protein [Umezawaea tangerina]PRY35248.1 putative OsmC-like protein [Umezawaea tangerina]
MSNVEVRRVGQHSFVASNGRGAEVRIGRKDQDGSFSPVELLLAAAAGCAAVTAETLITRRAGEFTARADHVQAEGAHEVGTVPVSLDYDLSGLDDAQRAALESVVRRAVDQLCTVTRTLKRSATTPLSLP